MSGLKRGLPELRFTSNFGSTPLYAVTPDEIDRYEVVTIDAPAAPTGLAATWVGTGAIAGTSTNEALVITNAIPDWPRNIEFGLSGSANGMAGTLIMTGYDQFGSSITETITANGTNNNGGTGVGTRVFGQFTSGSIQLGTAVGNGTTRVGLGTTGTTALFGLPFKLGGTTDVKILTFTAGTGAISVNGGTIAAFVNIPMSAIKSPFNVVGTTSITVWARPTFNSENLGLVANLPQRT